MCPLHLGGGGGGGEAPWICHWWVSMVGIQEGFEISGICIKKEFIMLE